MDGIYKGYRGDIEGIYKGSGPPNPQSPVPTQSPPVPILEGMYRGDGGDIAGIYKGHRGDIEGLLSSPIPTTPHQASPAPTQSHQKKAWKKDLIYDYLDTPRSDQTGGGFR